MLKKNDKAIPGSEGYSNTLGETFRGVYWGGKGISFPPLNLLAPTNGY